MGAEPGLSHRFPMLKRAVDHMTKQGRFDEALKILEEMLSLAPEDAGLSKLKARFAADVIVRAAQAQKIEAATRVLELLQSKVPEAHLGDAERKQIAKAKENLFSL